MEISRKEAALRKEIQRAQEKQKRVEEQLAELKRRKKAAANQLKASTNDPTWHRASLGWVEHECGYTGEMASARLWLRTQPYETYLQMVRPYRPQGDSRASLIDVERAAVEANLHEWTQCGEDLLLERAKQKYAAEYASFEDWQRKNPDKTSWRSKSATLRQIYLMDSIARSRKVDVPAKLNRGEAHDWIAEYGGNPRLNSAEVADTLASDLSDEDELL